MNLLNISSISSDSSDPSPFPVHSGPFNRSPNELLLCCLNARSLRNKSVRFVDLLSDSKADLFAVTEMWFTHNDTTTLVELSFLAKTYSTPCTRSNVRGGATRLFFRHCLDVTGVNSCEESSFEFREWLVSIPTVCLRAVIVDGPSYSYSYPVTITAFITE